MSEFKRISRTKAKAVARVLHRKAASGHKSFSATKITPDATATGSGVVHFRASKVVKSYQSRVSTRGKVGVGKVRNPR